MGIPSVDSFEGYEIEREIGRGGMAVVYLARQKNLNRHVALKILSHKLDNIPDIKERFLREARIVAQLSHPNIITIYDVGEIDGRMYISMEYIEGKDLNRKIRSGISVKRGLEIALALSRALSYAHEKGYIHRDIKPENVLFTKSDEVVLTDFGIAKSLDSEVTQLTQFGTSLGTPAYMAPEQFEDGTADFRSDLYSLGVMLFQMLTGKKPYDSKSMPALMFKHTSEPIPKLPEPLCFLQWLIDKLMAKNPEDRIESAEILINILDEELENLELDIGSKTILVDSRDEGLESDSGNLSIDNGFRSAEGSLLAEGSLKAEGSNAADRDKLTEAVSKHLTRSNRVALLMFLTTALAVVALLFMILRLEKLDEPVGRHDEISLSVLRFDSDSPESEYYADNLTVELTRMLQNVNALKVTSSSAVWTFSKAINLEEAVEKVETGFLLKGKVSQAKDSETNGRLEIEVYLYDSKKKQIRWENSYDDFPDKLLSIQNQIASDLVQYLDLGSDKNVYNQVEMTVNNDAYRSYLRGQDALRRGERSNLESATGFFMDAVTLDPSFALAYASLCKTYLEFYKLDRDVKFFESAEKACYRSITLVEDSEVVYLALGDLYSVSGQPVRAREHYLKSLGYNPENADAHIGLGGLMLKENRLQEAERAYKQAVLQEPAYWKSQNALGFFYMSQGLYHQASESYQKASLLTPQNAVVFSNLGVARFHSGEFQSAYQSWKMAFELDKDSGAYSNLGTAMYFLHNFEEALPYFEMAIDFSPMDHRNWGNLADTLRFIPSKKSEMKEAYVKAIQLADENLSVNPNNVETLTRLAVYSAALGDKESSVDMLSRAESFSGANIGVFYDSAVTWSLLGEEKKAAEAVKKLIGVGYPAILVEADPQFGRISLDKL